MNYFAATAIINFIFSATIGIFVFSKRKSLTNITFAAFALLVAFWSYGYFFWQTATNSTDALFWTKVLMAGAILIPAVYLHFVFSFVKPNRNHRNILGIIYSITTIFWLSNLSNGIVAGVEPRLVFSYWPIRGYLFNVFLVFWFSEVIFATSILLSAYVRSSGIKRSQYLIILIGMIVGYLGGSTNYFLWYGIPIKPWGNPLVTVYVACVAYAILEYEMFNIKLLSKKISIYLAFLAIVYASYSAITVLTSNGNSANGFVSFLIFGGIGFFLLYRIQRENSVAQQQHQQLVTRYSELADKHSSNISYISDIAHQLKTPLAIIGARLDLLRQQPQPQTAEIEAINEILNSTAATVKNLVNIGKIDHHKTKLHRTKTDLTSFLPPLLQDTALIIKPRKLRAKLPPSLILVDIDTALLREAIHNLLDNARKYTGPDGVITVNLAEHDSRAKLTIADNGIGIAHQNLPKIFNRNFQIDSDKQITGSAGLGLAITKWIIEVHGGTIAVESQVGRGTTFTVTLPLLVKSEKTTTGPKRLTKTVVRL